MDVLSPAALSERLRAAGLRATQPRLRVYQALAALAGHRGADEVYDHLLAGGTRLSRASVYNALEALVRAGVVLAADAGPGRGLFEAATRTHHHAVCRRCGRVSDIACVAGPRPCLTPSDPDWGLIDEAQVIFRGVCAPCAAAAATGPGRDDP